MHRPQRMMVAALAGAVSVSLIVAGISPAGASSTGHDLSLESLDARVSVIEAKLGIGQTTTTVTPSATATATTAPLPTVTSPAPPPPPTGARPFFTAADWLWNPIPANPKLDPKSSAVASALGGGQHVLDVIQYGVTLRVAQPGDPKVKVAFKENWGSNPHLGLSMPLDDVQIPPGGDKQYSIIDPVQGKVFALWGASNGGKNALWGSVTDISGDGTEHPPGTSTGSDIARHAAIITEAEISAGNIPHALFFSSNQVGSGFRFPAGKSDQSGSKPAQEGMRIQLDPTLDLTTLNLSKPAHTIAVALQRYGAYVGDGGGATVALIAEYEGNSISAKYKAAGVTGDYFGLNDIPWSKVRVLSNSTGT